MMNILVTGANGQLGSEMKLVASESKDNYIFTDVLELDITNANEVMKVVFDNDVKVIINCAAYTNVDRAEDEENIAEMLNATAVENLAKAVKQTNGVLIHVSTDYVFGGGKNNVPFTELHVTNPTNVYGKTKLLGEQFITQVGCHYIIIRTAWLYSEFGKNFVKTMINLIRQKKQLRVVFDQVGTPTYAYDLATAVFNIVEKRNYEGKDGIYHYSNEGVCSWFDFSKQIASYIENDTCDIQPCRSEEFPSKVIRPSYSVLDKTKIKNTFGITIPYWKDSLKICIDHLKSFNS